MAIHIPAPLMTTAKQLGLQTWVKSRKFQRDLYYQYLDECNSIMSKLAGDQPGELHESLANSARGLLIREGALLGHVLEVNKGPKDNDEWSTYLDAGGWVVLQSYLTACNSGKWPHD